MGRRRGHGLAKPPLIGVGDRLVTCTKISYESEILAIEAAGRARRDSGFVIEAYKCPHGDGWHIGRTRKGKRPHKGRKGRGGKK